MSHTNLLPEQEYTASLGRRQVYTTRKALEQTDNPRRFLLPDAGKVWALGGVRAGVWGGVVGRVGEFRGAHGQTGRGMQAGTGGAQVASAPTAVTEDEGAGAVGVHARPDARRGRRTVE